MTTVISLGGSLITPDEINTNFIKKMSGILKRKKGKFVVVCGGGATARKYQNAGRRLKINDEDLDWLGVYSTYLNAKIFSSVIGAKLLTNPYQKIGNERIYVLSGWKPGWSTDYIAILIAKRTGAKEVINLTNVPCVCDKDPNQFKNAKPVKNISWKEYRKITGEKWKPGINLPFDPIASRLAQEAGIRVVILKGITNLKKCLETGNFKGTVIE